MISLPKDLPSRPPLERAASHRFVHINSRHDNKICVEIDRWWNAAIPVYDQNESGLIRCPISGKLINGNARDDTTALLQRDEYEAFYARLVYAFNHDGDDDHQLNPEEILDALDEDWANDRFYATSCCFFHFWFYSMGDGDVDEIDFKGTDRSHNFRVS